MQSTSCPMFNQLVLLTVLEILKIPYTPRSEQLRVFCPLQHNKPSKSASGAFYIETGQFHCFNCKATAKDLGDFLLELNLQTRFLLKRHPECSAEHKERLHLISLAQKSLEGFYGTVVSTAQ